MVTIALRRAAIANIGRIRLSRTIDDADFGGQVCQKTVRDTVYVLEEAELHVPCSANTFEYGDLVVEIEQNIR